MSHDISDRLSYIDIADDSNPPDSSLINVIGSSNSKESNNTSAMTQQPNGKELRRISLPADAYRRSKFASWVQYNIPTPPSSRTNSNSSSHRSRSSAGSSSTSDTNSFSIPSPTSSPTSTEAPPFSPPSTSGMPPIPPRSSSLQSNTSHASTEDDQTKHATPLQSMSSSSSSSASSLSTQKKKKKKLLPLVSRIRLCPYDKCSKHAPNIEPPEPPPQLLMSALRCDHPQDQGDVDKRKSYPSTGLEQHHRLDREDNASVATFSPIPTPSSSSSTTIPWYDCSNTQAAWTSGDAPSNQLTEAQPPTHELRRRSSCPLSSSNQHTTTVQEAVMMRSFCSPAHSPRPPSNHKSSLASTINSSSTSTSSATSLPPDVYDHDHPHHRHQCLLSFSTMKPRSQPLRRRTSGKHEKKALRTWHDTLVSSLKNEQLDDDSLKSSNRSSSTSSFNAQSTLSKEKRERNALTRKFILREFYLTEVTFWNQLYYSKVMFGDPLQDSLERYGAFTRPSDLDLFANLPDLMQCSSQLIRSMAPYLDHPPSAESSASTPSTPSTSYQELPNTSSRPTSIGGDTVSYHHRRHLSQYEGRPVSGGVNSPSLSSKKTVGSNRLPFHLDSDARLLPSPNDQLLLGKELCMMANQFVVYLRCALDYKVNRKKLDHRAQHNKGFVMYQEKLSMRKETNQFYVHDFLIIPIQRIARYGLLLADLQKHTERTHPDYYHISRARMIVTALAVAMNKAQQ